MSRFQSTNLYGLQTPNKYAKKMNPQTSRFKKSATRISSQPHKNNLYYRTDIKYPNNYQNNKNNDQSYDLQDQFYSSDFMKVLGDENKNLKSFKEKLQKQKYRIVEDFKVIQQSIRNIIQDLKVSLHAKLDNIYMEFIGKYAELKDQIQQLRVNRKQNYKQASIQINNFDSNKQLLKQFRTQELKYINTKINQQNIQNDRQTMNHINSISQYIKMLYENPHYYNHVLLNQQFNQLKKYIYYFTKKMYQGQYIKNLQYQFLEREKDTKFNKTINSQRRLKTVTNNFQGQPINPKNSIFRQKQQTNFRFQFSHNQQNLITEKVQTITLQKFKTIKTNHQNSVLCAIVINKKFIATGSKDFNIHIYTIQGKKIATLQGNKANICTLAIIEDRGISYLASGSDYNCCSIIIWDTQNWSRRDKINCHKAAVTSLIDMADNQTFVSGSYDKTIHLYDHKNGKSLFSLSNEYGITSIVINNNKTKLISCGFNNTLSIWNINRKKNLMKVESISLQSIIQSDSMICTINASIMRNEIVVVGTKDGKIQLFNTRTRELQKTIQSNKGAIIQLVAIQRENKPNSPIIISCSAKDKALIITRTDTGLNSAIELQNQIQLHHGCGIGPKIFLESYNSSPLIGIVNQSQNQREVNMYNLLLSQ